MITKEGIDEETRTKKELGDLVAKLEQGVELSPIEINKLCRHKGSLELSDAAQQQLTQATTQEDYYRPYRPPEKVLSKRERRRLRRERQLGD